MSTKVSQKNFDNILDNYLYNLSDKISPFLYKLNITPNQITILGLISGLSACYYLYTDQIHLSFFLILLSAFFDDLDGHHARKYKLVSPFGDQLDHMCDVIKTLALFYVLYTKYFNEFYNIKEVFIFIFIINYIHNSCIYKITNTNGSVFHKDFCIYPKNNIEQILNITKHFQNGILIVYLYIYLYYIKYYKE